MYIGKLYICYMSSAKLLKGTLQTIVLKLLEDHDKMYGYEITQKVMQLSHGEFRLTEGALILHCTNWKQKAYWKPIRSWWMGAYVNTMRYHHRVKVK